MSPSPTVNAWGAASDQWKKQQGQQPATPAPAQPAAPQPAAQAASPYASTMKSLPAKAQPSAQQPQQSRAPQRGYYGEQPNLQSHSASGTSGYGAPQPPSQGAASGFGGLSGSQWGAGVAPTGAHTRDSGQSMGNTALPSYMTGAAQQGAADQTQPWSGAGTGPNSGAAFGGIGMGEGGQDQTLGGADSTGSDFSSASTVGATPLPQQPNPQRPRGPGMQGQLPPKQRNYYGA